MKKRLLTVLGICAAMLVGAVVLYASGTGGVGIPCPVHALTGLYCAGCGSSRALRSLLHLEFYQAFRYNPALVLMLPFVLLYIAARMVDYVRTGQNNVDARLSFRALWVLVVLLLVYSAVRNLPFFPFTLLVPTVLH